MANRERWATRPEDKDYAAADHYLSLLAAAPLRRTIVAALRTSEVVRYRANDILRAAALPLVGEDDPEVAKDLKALKKGKPLAVVLLVRGRLQSGDTLTVADGYHRICASYHVDEDTEIPCQIAAFPVIRPRTGAAATRSA